MLFLKIFFFISIAHACWIGWLAVQRPDAYAKIANGVSEKGTKGRLVMARMIYAWLTVLAISMLAVRFSLSFLPYEWGNWEDGDFTPLSDSLATLPSLLIAYIIGIAVDTAGLRNEMIARETSKAERDKEAAEAALAREKEWRQEERERHHADFKQASASAEKSAKSQQESYYKLSQSLASVQRELVRLKSRIPSDVLLEHEENEKVVKEKEAAAPKTRTYYSY